MAEEIDYLLTATIDGVQTFSDDNAALSRVAEWLDTPKGQVWGSPKWGHELTQYRHYPLNGATAAAMENSVSAKLPQDIANLTLSSVKVEPDGVDKWVITIGIQGIKQALTQEITL